MPVNVSTTVITPGDDSRATIDLADGSPGEMYELVDSPTLRYVQNVDGQWIRISQDRSHALTVVDHPESVPVRKVRPGTKITITLEAS